MINCKNHHLRAFINIAVLSSAFLLPVISHATNRVFLLGGQSNMVGMGVSSELEAPYNAPQDDVTIWNNGWVPLSSDFDNRPNHFGPELSFGRTIKEALPDDTIYLVKYGSNGKALYDDFKPYTGRYYMEMMKTFRAALANLDDAGIEYEISGMLWMQGESDAYESEAFGYEANLTSFIEVMRKEFSTPEMPFILGRVLNYFGGMRPPKIGEQTDPAQASIVRASQVRVAERTPNVAWIDTDGYAVVDPASNPGHYGTQGLLDMGKDFASAALDLISDPPEHVSTQDLIDEWSFYGNGIRKVERGMLYMKEAPGSLGVMTVSPKAYGPDVAVTYEIMPMTAASVCVVILSASDPGATSTLALPENYDGSMGHWINSTENTFFAFHNASHNRFPFAIRFPETRLIAEYHENVMMNGKFHKIEAGQRDGSIWLKIDNKLILEGKDDDPLGKGFIAFRIRGLSEEPAACLIRNVRIQNFSEE